MADGQIELQLTLETGEVVKAFANVETKAQDTGNKVESGWKQAFKTGIAVKAVDAVSDAFFKLGQYAASSFREAITEGKNAEAAVNKFNASLRAAGMFSAETSSTFQSFASEIQNTTKFTDEQALSFASLSLNYAKNAEEAKKLTQAAIALSAATGKDVESSIQTLGGTLQGTAGKLSKLGGGFDQLTKAQLESGAALDLVNQRFGSLAGAETRTFEGILNQISKAWGDLSENVGLVIVQSPKIKAALNFVLQGLRSLGDSFNKADIANGLDRTIKAFLDFGGWITRNILPVIEILTNSFVELGRQIGNVAGFIAETAAGNFKGALDTLVEDIKALPDRVSSTPFSDKANAIFSDFKTTIDNAAPSIRGSSTALGSQVTEAIDQGAREQPLTMGNLFSETFAAIRNDAVRTQVTIADVAKTMTGGLMNGITSAFAALGGALAKGENGLAAFGKAVLSALGGVAIQIGTILVAAGLGWSFIPGFQASSAAIPQGLLLITLGGALQALGGGGGAASKTSAGGGVSTTATTTGGVTAEEATANIPDAGTQLVVNVNGSIFDSDETGLRIADIIKTNFDRKDVRFA